MVSMATVIIILILIITCCCAVCTGNLNLCCAPIKCLCACFRCCTDTLKIARGRLKPIKKTTVSQEKIESILNTTNITFLDALSVKYKPNAPTIKPVEWKIWRLDDNYCLVAESGVNIYKYDVRSKAVFLGDERNETIQHPAENRQIFSWLIKGLGIFILFPPFLIHSLLFAKFVYNPYYIV